MSKTRKKRLRIVVDRVKLNNRTILAFGGRDDRRAFGVKKDEVGFTPDRVTKINSVSLFQNVYSGGGCCCNGGWDWQKVGHAIEGEITPEGEGYCVIEVG